MANNATPISVNVNFHNVSYANGVWSGAPAWNVPQNVNVPPSKAGDTMLLRFNLNAAAVPTGFTASFANTNPILFDQNWTGGPPSSENSTTITVDDTFNGLSTNQEYEYSVSVTLGGMVGTQFVSQTWTLDPDVVNESGTANVKVTHAAD